MGIPRLYFYGDIEGLAPALKGLEGDGYFRLCGKDGGGFPIKAVSGAENSVSCDGQEACIRFASWGGCWGSCRKPLRRRRSNISMSWALCSICRGTM